MNDILNYVSEQIRTHEYENRHVLFNTRGTKDDKFLQHTMLISFLMRFPGCLVDERGNFYANPDNCSEPAGTIVGIW